MQKSQPINQVNRGVTSAMALSKNVALRKIQQIDASRRTMLIFVAAAAFVAGIALVVSVFLARQIFFHTKVIQEKQHTLSVLDENLKNIEELKKNLKVLETSSALNAVKINDSSNALQPVLDALPAEPNADALGASLQNNFIGAVGGLTLESLTVHAQNSDGTSSVSGGASASSMEFSLTVSGTADKLKELLTRFERSIRVIDIASMNLQAGEGKLTLEVTGRAYYEPAQTVKLETKVVKP